MFSCFCCKAKIPDEDFSYDELPNKDQKSISTSKPNNKLSQKLKKNKMTTKDNNNKQQQKAIPEQGKDKYRQLTLLDFWKNTKKSPSRTSSRHNLYDSIKKKKILKSSSFVSNKTQDEPSLVQSTDQLKAKLKQYHSSKFNSAFSEYRKMSNENALKSQSIKPTQESEGSNKKKTSISPSPIKSDDSKGLFGSNKVANKPFTLNLNRVSEKPLFSSNLFASKFKQNYRKEPGFSEQSNQANLSAEQNLNEVEDQQSDKQSASFAQQDTTLSFGSSGLFKKNDSSLDSIFAKKRETDLLANKSKGVNTGSNQNKDEQMTKKQTENEIFPRRQSESPKKPSALFDIDSNKNTSAARSNTVKFVYSPYTNVVCYSCGEKGHYSPQCPINPKGDLSRYHCFRCGERGHFAQSCPDHYY